MLSRKIAVSVFLLFLEFVFFRSAGASEREIEVIKGLTMVSIPSGSFTMTVIDGTHGVQPSREVTVEDFWMARTPVTQAQYTEVMGNNPSYFQGDPNCPVEQVSWYDAVTYCNKLSKLAGLEPCYNLETWKCDFSKNGFRLPRETEWEFAARAGVSTKYCTGDGEKDLARAGWYKGNSSKKTHPVGKKEPNAWGLYDIHGNVWEWCDDLAPKSNIYRVKRGGSWFVIPEHCDLSFRCILHSSEHYNSGIGFRVVRSGN